MSSEHIVDFAMPRNRLFLARMRIDEDVVAATVPHENATGRRQSAHQILTIHKAMSFT